MINEHFFKKAIDRISIKELLIFLDANYDDNIHLNKNEFIYNLSSLEEGDKGDVSFLQNPKYLQKFIDTKSEFCLTTKERFKNYTGNSKLIIVEDSYVAMAKLAMYFYKFVNYPSVLIDKNENFKDSLVDKSVILGKNIQIGYNVVIGQNVTIEDGCIISHNCVISDGVKIGKNCVIYENSSIRYSIIGENCIIHPGVKIGQDGFGFAIDNKTKEIIKITHLGVVNIGNNVEIGANTTIDRGSFGDTVISDSVKLDNLVQIGHNAHIGKSTVIAAQVGIAGSAEIGMGCMFGGQSGMSGHISVGNFVQVAAKSGVVSTYKSNIKLGGMPAIPLFKWLRQMAVLKKLTERNIK